MDTGLATPLEVYQGLAAEGYQISYRRVPLSRERTPEAADLDVLHQQLMMQPVGECEEGLPAGSVLCCRVAGTCHCGLPCMPVVTWHVYVPPSPCGSAPGVAQIHADLLHICPVAMRLKGKSTPGCTA